MAATQWHVRFLCNGREASYWLTAKDATTAAAQGLARLKTDQVLADPREKKLIVELTHITRTDGAGTQHPVHRPFVSLEWTPTRKQGEQS